MTSSAGRWVSVRFPDGRVRFDWVPAQQPPAPNGQVGFWHVVTGTGRQATRWEWHAEPEAALVVQRASAQRPAQQSPGQGSTTPRRTTAPTPAPPDVRVAPEHDRPPPPMPPVRPEATVEVLPDKVYRAKRSMGVGFWMAAVILAAMAGAGAVAITQEDRAAASLTAEEKPDTGDVGNGEDDVKPTRTGLIRVAEGYLNALLGGDVDDLLSYLDPACDGADPGFAVAARWAEQLSGGATVAVAEVEIRGKRGSVTDFSLDGGSLYGDAEDDVRALITDETADGEQAFPWRFTGGEWYFKGDCGSP